MNHSTSLVDGPLKGGQTKREDLYRFILKRVDDNPQEKVYLREHDYDQMEHEEFADIEDYLSNLFNRNNIQEEFAKE